MRDFFVQRDLLLFGSQAGMQTDFSLRGFPAGHSESASSLVAMVSGPAPAPPVLVDDAAETDAATATNGNVLTNDTGILTIVAVNGLSANVGEEIAGSNGGEFTIAADGAWTFDPSGDFSTLTGTDTAETSVTYHASDGVSEAMATLTVTVSSADAQPWTPAAITTALWLDAADSSIITLNGSTVSEWGDKSGNARHVAPMFTTKPQYTAEQNSQNVLTFLNSPMKTSANFPLTGNVNASMFWVSSKLTVTKGNVFGWGVQDYNASCGVFDTNTLTSIAFYAANFNIPTIEVNAYRLHSVIKSEGSIATTTRYFRDGTLVAGANHSTNIPNVAAEKFYVGRWSTDTDTERQFHGNLAELIIMPAAAAVADRQHIEGYLAHKWGLADNLPSDHPYKTAAPTI